MSDTNIATTNRAPLVVLRERLEARKNELRNALPSNVNPDHFIRGLTTAAQINPDILACSFQSLWLAAMKACRDGLLPDGREGAIVPFKSTATWIPMYQGLLKRFRDSGMAKWITADVVREGEVFEHWVDQNGEHFKHVPADSQEGTILKVYAAALTTDGAFYVAVMPIAEINKVKAMSRATRDDSPWKVWPAEMMKKTALRRLSKMLPAGADIFGEDEVEDRPNAAPTPTYQIVERLPGAANALDQFAGKPEAADQTGQGGEVTSTAEATGENRAPSNITIAYDRGKLAKTTGGQRRAMPGEYRDEANKAEADAWLAGYDGKANPETGEVDA